MPVARDLHRAGQPAAQIGAEIKGCSAGTVPDPPCRDELGFAANARPRPHVARMPINRIGFGLLLAPDKRPNLVQLNHQARQVAQRLVLECRACLPSFREQLHNCILRGTRDARCGKDRITFDQAAENRRALFGVEFLHAC